MLRVLTVLIAVLMMSACGSSNVPSTPLTESVYRPPCTFENASADPDEDLLVDVKNMECGAKLRAQVLELQQIIKGP